MGEIICARFWKVPPRCSLPFRTPAGGSRPRAGGPELHPRGFTKSCNEFASNARLQRRVATDYRLTREHSIPLVIPKHSSPSSSTVLQSQVSRSITCHSFDHRPFEGKRHFYLPSFSLNVEAEASALFAQRAVKLSCELFFISAHPPILSARLHTRAGW